MSEFKKWMDISAKLFEAEDEVVEKDEVEVDSDKECDDELKEAHDVIDREELDVPYDESDVVDDDEPFDLPSDEDEDDQRFRNEYEAELEDEGDELMKSYDSSGEFGGPFIEDEIETGSGASTDVSDLLSEIEYYQSMGMSNTDKSYDLEKLINAPEETIFKIHQRVTGK